ncbi:uncharacterized protein [Dendropsophus ebraccatus]|uniref:uncharacterized protein n=1 Tax=Dendropsophus ebraccatus TaxID=150705 RepID=UPI0038310FBF
MESFHQFPSTLGPANASCGLILKLLELPFIIMNAQDKDLTKLSNTKQKLKQQCTSVQPNLEERPTINVTKAQTVIQVQESIRSYIHTPKSNLLVNEWRKRLLETQFASSKVKTRSKSLSPINRRFAAFHSSSALRCRSASPAPSTTPATSHSFVQSESISSSSSKTARLGRTNLSQAPLTLQFPTNGKMSIIPDKKKDYRQRDGEKRRHDALPRDSVCDIGTCMPSPKQERQKQTSFVEPPTIKRIIPKCPLQKERWCTKVIASHSKSSDRSRFMTVIFFMIRCPSCLTPVTLSSSPISRIGNLCC